jgi:hypothetical protein
MSMWSWLSRRSPKPASAPPEPAVAVASPMLEVYNNGDFWQQPEEHANRVQSYPSSNPDPEHANRVQSLIDVGFSDVSSIERALRVAQNNVDLAFELLLNGQLEETAAAVPTSELKPAPSTSSSSSSSSSASSSSSSSSCKQQYSECTTREQKICWLHSERGQRILQQRPLLLEYYNNGR